MPFRRWFSDHGAAHPAAYSMLTLALGMLVCMIISVVISVQASDRARTEQRQADCADIIVINDAYRRQAGELTAPGKDIAGAWERIASRCK